MTDPIPKYNRDRSTWSAEDFARHDRSGVLPVNAEWIRGMHEAADTFNLEDSISDTTADKTPADRSAEDWLATIKRGQA